MYASPIDTPVMILAALGLLLIGPWCFKRSSAVFLGAIAVIVVHSLLDSSVDRSTAELWFICVSAGILGITLSKIDAIARASRLLLTVLLCVLWVDQMGAWLNWPIIAVWVVMLAGAHSAPIVVISTLAAALINEAFGFRNGLYSTLILGGILGLFSLLSGRMVSLVLLSGQLAQTLEAWTRPVRQRS